MHKIIVLFVLASLGGVGCTSRSDANSTVMQSWVGRHVSEVIAAWGPPPFVRDDGQGGQILVYGHFNHWNRMFYVNEHGRIYSWRWQGY